MRQVMEERKVPGLSELVGSEILYQILSYPYVFSLLHQPFGPLSPFALTTRGASTSTLAGEPHIQSKVAPGLNIVW